MKNLLNIKAHAEWSGWLRKIVESPSFSLPAFFDHFIKHIREEPREESNQKSWFASTINMIGLLMRATGYRVEIFSDDIDFIQCNKMFERHEEKMNREIVDLKAKAWDKILDANDTMADATNDEWFSRVMKILEEFVLEKNDPSHPIHDPRDDAGCNECKQEMLSIIDASGTRQIPLADIPGVNPEDCLEDAFACSNDDEEKIEEIADEFKPEDIVDENGDEFHADKDCKICHGKYYLSMPPGVNVDPPMECPSCKGKYIQWMAEKINKAKENH